jgi:hypothetical protein
MVRVSQPALTAAFRKWWGFLLFLDLELPRLYRLAGLRAAALPSNVHGPPSRFPEGSLAPDAFCAEMAAGPPVRHVKIGSIIVHEHRGELHEVMVVPGGFCWRGQVYASLWTPSDCQSGCRH